MLSDRSYMRDPQPGGRTSVVVWLVAAIAAGFILQNFVTKILGQGLLLEAVGGYLQPTEGEAYLTRLD